MKASPLTREELKILELFRDSPLLSFNISEIAKNTGKSSYRWVFGVVKKLNKLGILGMESRGGSNFCSLNLGSSLALTYLALLEQLRIPGNLPAKNIQRLISLIPASYFTFIIAGSYARGSATKNSDLDVAVITEGNDDAKRAMVVLANEGELMMPKAHVFAFSKEDFLKMLLEKEENYGKQIFRNRLILFGAENYYLTIKEAAEHGFRG